MSLWSCTTRAFPSDVLGVVQAGMQMVATEGTASNVFANYPVSIAAKTGTAETSNLKTTDPDYTEPNLSFICYAPANDPEIAIAVMMEHGNSGNYAKNVAKDIWTSTSASTPGTRTATSSTRTATRWTTAALSLRQPRKSPRSRLNRKAPPRPSTGDSDASSGTEPASTPAPTTDRGSDIPDTPFTGESASPSPSPDSGQESGEGSSSSDGGGDDGDEGSSASAPDGPYYSSG